MVDQPNPQYDESEAPLPQELRKVVEQIAQQTPSDERVRRILAKSQAALNAAAVQATVTSRPARGCPENLPFPEGEGNRGRFFSEQTLGPARRRLLLWTSLAVAASLGVAALGWWLHASRTAATSIAQDPRPIQAIPDPASAPAIVSVEELPTVWACNRALRESPEALEAFLDRATLPRRGKPLLARNLDFACLVDQTL